MKRFKLFLFFVLLVLPSFSVAQVATTAGSNLTAWNGNSAATNNNNWNQMTNARAQAVGSAPKADFGNCNSLIMRCAQPKCSGCTTIEVARPIVAGCVNSNATCKQHGNDLIDYIAAQLVATANSKAQQAELAAQQAAAAQVAAQNNAQLQQMQAQMANMQQQMQQQSAQQMAQMQAALAEQKALVAAAQAEATLAKQDNVALNSVELTRTEQARAATGEVSADVLARERIEGQILSEIESAEDAMKNLKSTMQSIFSYAGCDSRGNNCRGPKRVSVFKQKAMQFFDPFDNVADAMYDALEKAMAVGVDVSDVVMMLSGACNQWGKYMCVASHYDTTAKKNSHSIAVYGEDDCVGGRSKKGVRVKGGMECSVGMAVPPQDDNSCTLIELIDSDDTEQVERQWLAEYDDDDKLVRMGCATSSLDSISIFGRRRSKKQSALDLDTLELLINQDSMDGAGSMLFSNNTGDDRIDRIKYCGMSNKGYQALVAAVKTKKLPKTICKNDRTLTNDALTFGRLNAFESILAYDYTEVTSARSRTACDDFIKDYKGAKETGYLTDCTDCEIKWYETDKKCRIMKCNCIYVYDKGLTTYEKAGLTDKRRQYRCEESGGLWDDEKCHCDEKKGLKLDVNGNCYAYLKDIKISATNLLENVDMCKGARTVDACSIKKSQGCEWEDGKCVKKN